MFGKIGPVSNRPWYLGRSGGAQPPQSPKATNNKKTSCKDNLGFLALLNYELCCWTCVGHFGAPRNHVSDIQGNMRDICKLPRRICRLLGVICSSANTINYGPHQKHPSALGHLGGTKGHKGRCGVILPLAAI